MKLTILVILVMLCLNTIKAEELRWDLMHQSDYKVVSHHVEVKWVNESYIKLDQFELVKYNRSHHRTLNASATLFKEYEVQLYKFVSNTYKYFPMGVILNFCKEWKRNSFQVRDMFAKYTNMKPCPLKPGYIYAIYLDADDSTLPPLMPRGIYKLSVKVFNRDEKLIEIEYFGEIIENKKVG